MVFVVEISDYIHLLNKLRKRRTRLAACHVNDTRRIIRLRHILDSHKPTLDNSRYLNDFPFLYLYLNNLRKSIPLQ